MFLFKLLPIKLMCFLGGVTYRLSCAMRHNGAQGWGVIANDVLKMRTVTEFQRLCPAAADYVLCR